MSNLSNFNFQSHAVRTYVDGTQTLWFLANDVCSILGYANPRQAIQKNCKDKGVSKRDTPTEGGGQEMTYINEANLYRLIIKSRKPEAEAFESWVMEEVLPAIRKTGQYTLPNTLTPAQQNHVQRRVAELAKLPGSTYQSVYHGIKNQFKVGTYKDIPVSQYTALCEFLQCEPIEGEWLEADKKGKYHLPLELWNPKNRVGRTGWITYEELNRMEGRRPLAQLLHQVKADGNDIKAAEVEYKAIESLLESMFWKFDRLKDMFGDFERRGWPVHFSN